MILHWCCFGLVLLFVANICRCGPADARLQLSYQLTLLSLRASKMKFRSQMLRGVSLVLFMVANYEEQF